MREFCYSSALFDSVPVRKTAMGKKKMGQRQSTGSDEAATAQAARDPGRAPLWIISLIVAIPVVVVALFWQFGSSFQSPEPGTAPSTSAAAADQAHDDAELAAMAAKLAARLENQPGDIEGMAMLARTYYTMRDYAKAVEVFARLVPTIPDDASILADYADALAVTQGNDLTGTPMELVTRALKADPANWKALAMAATDAFRRKDYAKAIAHWEKARASVTPGSELVRSIDASIAQARELAAKR